MKMKLQMREEDFCLFFSPVIFSFHAGKMGQIYQCAVTRRASRSNRGSVAAILHIGFLIYAPSRHRE